LPLPAGEKSPPPKGFTGEDGVDPNSEQIDIWREKEGDGNTALRLPDGAVGVDVDAYDAKQGGATLEALETTWGPLPPTWISTSRIDTVSGIRLYRIPPGVKLAGDAGAGIEILQHHHRYAVVWPSINPMTNRRYRWYAPDGSLSNRVPRVDELPELPAAWVSGLTAQSLSTESPRVATTPSAHWSDEVKRVHGDALTDMATGRSRHDTVTQAALALARLEERGHPGATEALEAMGGVFVEAISADRASVTQAEKEWQDILASARRKVAETEATTHRYRAGGDRWGLDRLMAQSELIGLEQQLRQFGADGLERVAAQAARLVQRGLDEDEVRHRLLKLALDLDMDEARAKESVAIGLAGVEDRHSGRQRRHLPVLSAAELDALVRAAPTPRFLIKKVWAEDAYGVIGAQDKAGKTFLILDAAVSVASGTAWLDSYLIERPGPVLAFLGEGGERKMHRRLVAIARSRSLELPRLDIHLCFRVPHLGDHDHLEEVADLLATHRPALVILDPLYLAARGAKGSQLIDMGEHLEEIQLLTQAAGSALMVVHHWNQTGAGTGPERFSGAGLAEWGRVRISMAVKSRTDGAEDEESDVVFSLAISGDETMEREVWFRRRVWTEDADDLASDMHYEIEPMEAPEAGPTERDDEEALMEKASAEFAAQGERRLTQERAVELLRDIKVRGAVKRTALEKMVELGCLGDEGRGNAHKYFFIKPYKRAKAGFEYVGDNEDAVARR